METGSKREVGCKYKVQHKTTVLPELKMPNGFTVVQVILAIALLFLKHNSSTSNNIVIWAPLFDRNVKIAHLMSI